MYAFEKVHEFVASTLKCSRAGQPYPRQKQLLSGIMWDPSFAPNHRNLKTIHGSSTMAKELFDELLFVTVI